MKILFAIHQFFPDHHAGTEVITLGLARELKRRGHEPFVLAAKRSVEGYDMSPGGVESYELDGIGVRRVGRPDESPSRPYRLNYENQVMADRARDYVREVRPDVVHVMHLLGLSASVLSVFKEFDLPIVYTATDFWAVCPEVELRRHDGTMCTGPEFEHCLRCVASKLPDRRKDVLIHMPDAALRVAEKAASTRLSRHSFALRQMDALRQRTEHVRAQLELVDHVIAPTQIMRDMLVRNGVATNIEVSRYGIEQRDIRPEPAVSAPPPLRLGYMGTLAEHKGCDTLIRAFRKLPAHLDVKLTIHGNLERFAPYVAQLRELAGNDPRITFAGSFSSDRVGSVLSTIHALVVPSRWYENTPLVVQEAFLAGVPVVGTNLAGIAEAVRPEDDALLFELDDVADLTRQLRRLAEEPGLLERLRSGVRPAKTVQENVTELEQLYRRLTGTQVEETQRSNAEVAVAP